MSVRFVSYASVRFNAISPQFFVQHLVDEYDTLVRLGMLSGYDRLSGLGVLGGYDRLGGFGMLVRHDRLVGNHRLGRLGMLGGI